MNGISITHYDNFGDELPSFFKMLGGKKEQEAKIEQAKAEGKALSDIAWYGRGTKQAQSSALSELLGAGIAGKQINKNAMWVAAVVLIAAFALFMYFVLRSPKPAANG